MNWKELYENGSSIFGGAVSGGLDSCTVTHWLNENGVQVHCFTVDLGQPDEENLQAVVDRMLACGASQATILPGKELLADAGLKVLQAQARYEGGYWNTTGIARPVTVKAILDSLKNDNINVLFHGATGRGNDQVRFQLTSNMLQPDLDVYAPWRDQEFLDKFPGRKEMIEYCELNNLPIRPAKESRYSTDANFLGLTHEAGDLEDVSISPDFVEPGMGVWPWDAPDKPEYVTIYWDQGVPKSINGTKMDLTGIFHEANIIAGRNGVGIGTHVVENRFVGIKSRGIYETPGGTILNYAHRAIESITLNSKVAHAKEAIISRYSELVYNGFWFSEERKELQKIVDIDQSNVNGEVKLRLIKGNIIIIGRKSENSLYNLSQVSFENNDVDSQENADQFIRSQFKKINKKIK